MIEQAFSKVSKRLFGHPLPWAHRFGQQLQAHRVLEQCLHAPLTGRRDECLRIVDAGTAIQDLDNVRFGQRIEAQDCHLGVLRHGSQISAVIVSQPIGFTARETETWSSKLVEPAEDIVKRRAYINRPGPDFIESVNIESLVAPFRRVVHIQFEEFAGGDLVSAFPKCIPFGIESSRFAGPGVAKQHVGLRGPELFQGPRLLITLSCKNLSAGAGDSVVHVSSNHRWADTVRNSSSGMPPSPTSNQRWGLNCRLNSSMPRKGRLFKLLFTSMGMTRKPR